MEKSYDPSYFSMLAKSMRLRNDSPKIEKNEAKDVVVHTLLCAREVELLIREFNPSKYIDLYAMDWIRQIETLGYVHKWDDDHLILYATMRMSGVAKVWYEYALEDIRDWDDFKRELLANFPRATNAAAVHATLVAKKRLPDEPLEEYFHTTVQLAKKARLHDDSIRDYLIQGLQQPKHQMILSTIESSSLTEFLLHMQRLEKDSPCGGHEEKSKASSSIREKPRESVTLLKRGVERVDRYREQSRSLQRASRRSPERRQSARRRSDERRQAYVRSFSRRSPERRSRPSDRRRSPTRDSSRNSTPNSQSNRSTDKSVNGSSAKKTQEKKCYMCGQMDHLVAKCPKKLSQEKKLSNRGDVKSEKTPKNKLCYICDSDDHLASKCSKSFR